MNGSIRIPVKLDRKSFDAQISQLEADLKRMTATLESDATIDVKYKMSEAERIKLESDIEKVKNRIAGLQQQKEKLKGSGADFSGMQNGFNKLLKSAKKLALGIIGVRGAYMLFRKATSAYMEDNKQLSKDMEANWTALGTIMSGVIEALVNGFRKLVTGILYFMQCLTGTNYIAKANEAILKKQTKATNDLAKANKKLTTSFDELQVMQDNSNASEDDGSTYRLLDLNELGSGTIQTIENLTDKFKPIYEMIKDIIRWAIDHPGVVLQILGASAIISMASNVIGTIGTLTSIGGAMSGTPGTGLAGIYALLSLIAAIGTIELIIKTVKNFKDLKETAKTVKENSKEIGKFVDANKEAELDYIATMELSNEEVEEAVKNKAQFVKEIDKTTQGWINEKRNASATSAIINTYTGHLNALDSQIDGHIAMSWSQIEVMKELNNKYDLGEEGTKAYREALEDFVDTTENGLKPFGDFGYTLDETGKLMDSFGQTIDEPTTELEKQIYWYLQAKNELKGLDKSVDDSTTFFQHFRDKIREVNGSKAKVELELDTPKSNKLSDRLISAGKTIGLSSITDWGYRLQRVGLATGGIVNMPGRGVPLGNVVTGEVSQEGVIPLTDEQAMETLGEAIGRHVNIQATLINQINGRTLSKEVRKIVNDEDFAYNR